MSGKYIVTWDMLQIYTKQLAAQLMVIKKWKHIIAVSRGGLVPAALLSRELSVRFVDTVCIASYHYNRLQKNTKIIKKSSIDSKYTLIVDDLSDSGRTVKILRKMYPKSYFVTIFAKPKSCMLIDSYVVNVDEDMWIEQPWDMQISYSFPLVRESKIIV